MKATALAALALALALPAAAQDAKPTEGKIDASFTWTSVDLASLPAGETEELYLNEAHLVVTANEPGLFDGLGGRCLLLMRVTGADAYTGSGSCLLADADGDRIYERVEEASGKGHATITGGTGKFAGITSEYDFTTTWYASVREGTNQGVGTKTGTWHMSGS
jgi:hypothetical protein